MRVKLEDLYEGPRYEKRAKNRRYNKLLNLCIALVLLLILFFTYRLIFGGNDEATTNVTEESMVSNEESSAVVDEEEESSEATESTEEDRAEETATENTEDTTTEEESTEDSSTEGTTTVLENSDDPNVKETVIKDNWQPVSTTQAEPHVATYDSKSVDWQEMNKALQQATNLSEGEYTLWRIGNDGSEHRAKAVVSSKDQLSVYRVYIEWVTNEGWKPSKLEILHEVPAEYKGGGSTEEESSTEDEESAD
ncbi:YrrS family protein [Bacillus sp. AK128]